MEDHRHRESDRIAPLRAYRRMYSTWPEAVSPPESMPGERVEVDVAVDEKVDTPWFVVLYNDAIHTFDEVIIQLVKATRCTTQDAEKVAWTVHTRGKAQAFEGTFEDCYRVQSILREIELVTEITG